VEMLTRHEQIIVAFAAAQASAEGGPFTGPDRVRILTGALEWAHDIEQLFSRTNEKRSTKTAASSKASKTSREETPLQK
jgi:hypothetical protein